jgi:hypothetical protein
MLDVGGDMKFDMKVDYQTRSFGKEVWIQNVVACRV